MSSRKCGCRKLCGLSVSEPDGIGFGSNLMTYFQDQLTEEGQFIGYIFL